MAISSAQSVCIPILVSSRFVHQALRLSVFPISVTQSRDIKKQKKRLEDLKADAELEKARILEAARERVLRDFEKSQLGLASKSSTPTASSSSASNDKRESVRVFLF